MYMLTGSTESFGLQGPESYAYTSMSNCLEVQDVDDVKEFHDTIAGLVLYSCYSSLHTSRKQCKLLA